MSDIKERLINNIRAEVRNFLKNDIPMPDRDPRWDDVKAKILVEERELHDKEIEAKHMADYETMNDNLKKSYEQSNSGIPYDEWLNKAKKLYTIDGSTVTSIAKGPSNANTVDAGSPWQAKKRVLKLIAWKYRDHFKRGHDFMFDPDKYFVDIPKEEFDKSIEKNKLSDEDREQIRNKYNSDKEQE